MEQPVYYFIHREASNWLILFIYLFDQQYKYDTVSGC
jgi:hypothetical protein